MSPILLIFLRINWPSKLHWLEKYSRALRVLQCRVQQLIGGPHRFGHGSGPSTGRVGSIVVWVCAQPACWVKTKGFWSLVRRVTGPNRIRTHRRTSQGLGGLQLSLTRAKPLFFGQKLNFSGKIQQPKMKKSICL